MARSGSLSRRIDRLLNETAFRQAFAAGRYRVAAAVLLVPIALFATTSLIRVQAAGQEPPQPPPAQPTLAAQPPAAPAMDAEPAPKAALAPAAVPETGQSHPPAAPILVAPAAPAAPVEKGGPMHLMVPAPPIGPFRVVIPQTTVVVPKMVVVVPKFPPMPPLHVVVPKFAVVVPKIAPMPPLPKIYALAKLHKLQLIGPGVYSLQGSNVIVTRDRAYVYRDSVDGESFVLVKRNGQNEQLAGSWADGHREEIAKARKLAQGDFLWFTHKGKSYFIDDPSVVAQVEGMNAQQEALGKEQEALGRRQKALGRQQEELSRRQRQASIPTPDMQKEIAGVEAAMAELKAKQGKSLTTEEWADIQSKLGNLQGKLGAIRGEIGARQGAFGGQQGELGSHQGELGKEQGQLGERQARLALETQRKVKSIIDQSLSSGKARPVN